MASSVGYQSLERELAQKNLEGMQDKDTKEEILKKGEIKHDENEDENYEGILNYDTAMQVFNQMDSDGLDGNNLVAVRNLEERLKFIALLDEQENELQAKILQQQEQLDINQGLIEEQNQQKNQIQERQELNNCRQEKGQYIQGIYVPSLIVSSPNVANNQKQFQQLASTSEQQIISSHPFSSNYQEQLSPQKGQAKNDSSVISKQNFIKTPPAASVGSSSDQNSQNTKKKTKFISSPNPSYARPKQVHETTPSIQYSFQPQISSKSKKLAEKIKKQKDLSGKYLYEDFLLRREKQTQNEDKELALTEAQSNIIKISSNSQKIILSKIDKALSGIIESLQEGEFLSYQSLALLYSQISLFSSIRLNKIDENQEPLSLKKDNNQVDLARLNSEMNFLQQSYKILSLSTPDQGVPKKLIFDFLMVLFETKMQLSQTIQILTDVLLAQLGIVTAQEDSQEKKDAFIKTILTQAMRDPEIGQIDNGSESLGENWDLTQVVISFRKLYNDKTSFMEWYTSRNINNQGGQNCSHSGNICKCLHENTECRFRPEINKKSKFLDSCLLNIRENNIKNCNRSANEEDIKTNKGSCVEKSRFQLLYEDSKYLQQKKKENQELALREQKINCTFKPHVNSSSKGFNGYQELLIDKNRNEKPYDGENNLQKLNCRDQQQYQSIHERLYKHYSKKSEAMGEVIQAANAEKAKQELQECTFKPNIITSNMNNENKSVDNIKGAMQQLERLQKARALQQEKDSFFERQRKIIGQNYQGLTETIPFSFDNNEMHNSLSISKRERQIIGNVEVNLSKGKKGKIVVYKGDNPEKLANNFAKIYSLNEDMKNTLAEMLAGYIQKIQENNGSHDSQEKQINQSEDQESNEEYSEVESVNQVVSTIVVEGLGDQEIKEFNQQEKNENNCISS